jgi:hypothetical protein
LQDTVNKNFSRRKKNRSRKGSGFLLAEISGNGIQNISGVIVHSRPNDRGISFNGSRDNVFHRKIDNIHLGIAVQFLHNVHLIFEVLSQYSIGCLPYSVNAFKR